MGFFNNLFGGGSKAPSPAPAPVKPADAPKKVAAATPVAGKVRRDEGAAPKPPAVRAAEPVVVESDTDLPLFSKTLYDVMDLRGQLRHKICPVLLEKTSSGKEQFCIILLAEELRADTTEEVVKALRAKYAEASPLYYVAPRSLMIELARDIVTENKKQTGPKVKGLSGSQQDGALWSLLESAATFAMKNDASDLHFEIDHNHPKSQLRFRVDGKMTAPPQFKIDTGYMLDAVAFLYNVKSNSGSENLYNENKAQQCQIAAKINSRKLLFRWASNQTANGTKVVLRMLYQDVAQTVRSLEELGYLPSQIAIWMRSIGRLGGGIVIAGVVGSGKSTTMQTILSLMPDWMSLYSVEDPVEYILARTSQFSVSRTMSDSGTDPFLAAKRQLKRMDPDLVMIGEIRDKESAGLFRDIAESGHRAFTTVHAPSAIDLMTLRLVSSELGIPRDVVATPGFLNLLVYQALVPKLCDCKLPAAGHYPEEYLAQIERLFDIKRDKLAARNPEGCTKCRRESLPELNGSRGRVVVAEMIEPNAIMLDLVRLSKNIELKEYIRGMRGTTRFDEEDSTGKSAMQVSLYYVSKGILDPKEVELKFGSFDAYEAEQAL